jgi:Fic family protein
MGSGALFRNEREKRDLVNENLARQFRFIQETLKGSGCRLELRPELIKELHRIAMQGVYSCAGTFRDRHWKPRVSSVRIIGSKHSPPEDDHVEGLVEQLCETVNQLISDEPLRATAMMMWKLAWIHPFRGGNGRSARAAAYLTLCVGLKQVLPGRPTIAEYLDANRARYIEALQDADAAWRDSQVPDVSMMVRLLDDMLTLQLASRGPIVAHDAKEAAMPEASQQKLTTERPISDDEGKPTDAARC